MIKVFCKPHPKPNHVGEIESNVVDLRGRFVAEIDGISYDCTYTSTRDNLRHQYSKGLRTFMELSLHERINQKHNNTLNKVAESLYRKGTAFMVTYSMMHDNNTKHFTIF